MSKARGIVFESEVSRDVEPGVVTLYDRSRFANNGTMTDITWAQLPSGLWVMDFDGTAYIRRDNPSFNNPTGSISLWANFPTSALVPNEIVFAYGLNNNFWPDMFWLLYPSASRFRFQLQKGGPVQGFDEYTTIGSVTNDIWQNWVLTQDRTAPKLYRNGLLILTISTGANIGWWFSDIYASTARRYSIGALVHAVSNQVTASLSQLRIYNYALTAGQILNHYEATRRDFGV